MGIGAGFASTVTLPNDKFPDPSVVIYWPFAPPVIFTLLIFPKFDLPVTDKLPVKDALAPLILPDAASSVILPVVTPFLATKFFVNPVVATVPYSLFC